MAQLAEGAAPPRQLAGLHALLWLVAGNAVGAWMAALLLWPRLGQAFAPLTYGRWAALHLDLHLYGWASLPLVALLLTAFSACERAPRLGRFAVQAWSAMLVVGAAAWLTGQGTGKPFLDWAGPARLMLVVAMLVLWAALALAFARGLAPSGPSAPSAPGSRAATAGRAALLLGLLAVPFVLAWAARPDVYPSINPDSGGPTGTSLMGSVLGMAALLIATPWMLGLQRAHARTRAALVAPSLLALHGALFLALDHGDHSHRETLQVIALASTLAWPPLLTLHLRHFTWPRAGRGWLVATAAWGVALAVSGVVAFLPGVLESWKFTSALVAHAHVALAGFVTSWNLVLLVALAPDSAVARALSGRWALVGWNGALLAHVLALAALAALEMRSPGNLPDASARGFMGLRLAAGLAQLAVSLRWAEAAWEDS